MAFTAGRIEAVERYSLQWPRVVECTHAALSF